jgi:thiosulfate/3-mercaptopyruvate sulfurtransferase
MRWVVMTMLMAGLMLAGPLSVKADAGALVTEAELYSRLAAPATVVLDVSPAEVYAQGHIPGARHLTRSDLTNPLDPIPSELLTAAQMEALLQRLGIRTGDELYLYSQTAFDAARLWWTLEFYGVGPVHLLNGNLQTWKEAGYPVAVEASVIAASDYRLDPLKFKTGVNLSTTQLRSGLRSQFLLVDARSPAEYTGQVLTAPAQQRGRIPGAVNVYWKALLDASGRFKSPEDLQDLFRQQGITGDRPVVVYCHSGFQSALNYFVLSQILGYEQVSNYDGSWVAWSRDLSLPMECDCSRFTIGAMACEVRSMPSLMDTAPYIKEGRAFLPVRQMALALGIREKDILWDGTSGIVTLTKGSDLVRLTLGQNRIWINGAFNVLETPPELRAPGRLMLPARALAEAFGGSAFWDEAGREVLICSQDVQTTGGDCGCAS